MAQRLALQHILNNQLIDYDQNTKDTIDLTKPTKKDKDALRVNARAATMYSRYFSEKRDIKSTFDNIVSKIHNNMKISSPPMKSVPSIPEPIAQIPDSPLPYDRKSSKSTLKVTRRMKGGQNTRGSTTGNSVRLSIPAIKAVLEQKTQKMMRRGFSDANTKNFTNQRRIREVLQQKTMLEGMLMQHKRLQRDRQIIALDIQRMRQDLDRIRNKLDTSLQNLNSTRSIFSGTSPIVSRKLQANNNNSSSSPVRRSTLTNAKGKNRSEAPLRANAVTQKRQLSTPAPTPPKRSSRR